MKSQNRFYVYFHARPNGIIFYVGKGKDRRAWDFAPSRRTKWHYNIVKKYGKKNIVITILPVKNEQAAFALESKIITTMRNAGKKLINLTNGGEGTSGRKMSEAQKAGLSKGRGKNRILPEGARQRILEGLARGRAQKAENKWHESIDGRKHAKKLGTINAAITNAREPFEIICQECGGIFKTKSLKARFCSKACNQRFLRAEKRKVAKTGKTKNRTSC